MKKILLLLPAVLFLLQMLCVTPQASAQGWAWGRAGSAAGCEGWAVAIDPSGNVYGGGMNQYPTTPLNFSGVIIPPYSSMEQYQSVWVKYNSSGAVLWAGGTVSGATCLQNISSDPFGDLIIMGSFTSDTMIIGSFTLVNAYNDGSAQYFLAKVSPDGAVLWAVNDGVTVPEAEIIDGMLGAGSVTTDDTGNIYITSAFRKRTVTIGSHTLTNADVSGFSYDIFVAKYTPAGAVAWVSSVGGVNDDYPLGITVTHDGNVYIAGAFWSPSIPVGSSDLTNPYGVSLAFIAKFSPSGAPLWGQSAGINEANAAGVASDNDGNVYMTGSFFDSTISFGSVTVNRAYPACTAPAMFLVKYAPADTAVWAKIIETETYQVIGYSVSWAPCAREVWVSGNFYGTALLGSGVTLPLPGGADPVLLAGYDPSGTVIGSTALGSGADDQAQIACDAAGDIYLCADILGSVVAGSDTLEGIGGEEAFDLLKYINTVVTPPDTTYASKDTTVICTGNPVVLSAPPGYTHYLWDNDSTASSCSITASGQYYVYCISCTAVLVDTINVVIISDSLYTHTDTIACTPSDVFYLTLTAPVGTNYLWYDDSTTATHNENATGAYWVSYTTGCDFITDTFDVTLTNSSPPCATAVNNPPAPQTDITIFPNPATDELTIMLDPARYTSLSITNGIGWQLLRQDINSGQTKVDVNKLPPGLYYIIFSGGIGNKQMKFTKI